MKSIPLMIGMFSLATVAVHADVIRLADGTTLEGELGAPSAVIVKTATGERQVQFNLLPADVQLHYWRGVNPEALAGKPAPQMVSQAVVVTPEDLASLANEVNLDTWEQVAAIGSFRDRPEKRGSGGLVVSKAFNALEENWVSVYSPKDPVGAARNWEAQVSKAKQLRNTTVQFMQRRWLDLFIKAGEAVGRRDSDEFALLIRELKRSSITTAAVDNPKNFFTAK